MSDPSVYGYVIDAAQQFVAHAIHGLPEEASWVSIVVLAILGAAATIDAMSESVPDVLIFLGLLAITAIQGMYVSWPFAAHHLTYAIADGFVIWAINEVCLRMFKRDVLSMSDAKWTILAVSCFDVLPVLYAWAFAVVLGVLKIFIIDRFRKKPPKFIHWTPLLFPGLLVSLYILRM